MTEPWLGLAQPSDDRLTRPRAEIKRRILKQVKEI